MPVSTSAYGTSNEEANRHRFIRDLLHDAFPTVRVESIDKMGRNNNHMHLVHLAHVPDAVPAQPAAQPGTVALPTVLPQRLVVRIHNAEGNNTDFDPARKVRNEVAAMALARAAGTIPVPDVYLWSDEGWTFVVMEHVRGVTLSTVWDTLSREQHAVLAVNVARALRAVRALPVPHTYGTLDFDAASGAIVAHASASSAATTYAAAVRAQLAAADANPRLGGWRAHGLRARVERFLADASAQGFAARVALVAGPPTMTHGDVYSTNVLVDPSTLALTALLDWELSRVAAPADEFFMSLGPWGFLYSLSSEDDPADPNECARRAAMLSGVFAPETADDAEWTAMRALGDALTQEDVARPATIPHFHENARLYWFTEELNHWYYKMERYWTSTKCEGALEKGEAALDRFLKEWGF